MSDSATSTTVPAWYETYLWLPRRNAPVTFEDFLSRWAEQGYLVIGVAEDVASHGDAQFLQARRAPKPRQTAALYWQQHAALHEQLCAMGLRHMPVGLGPEPGEPFAIAWLLPAPAKGKLYAPAGFEQTVKLSREQRNDWLDWVAREVLAAGGPAQRVLLQPPGTQPACWNYGPYRGDAPLDGPHTERLRTLLAALPRYAFDIATTALAPTPEEAAAWPFLLNQQVSGTIDGMRREQGHQELFLISLPEVETYWLSDKPDGVNKLHLGAQPTAQG